MGSASESRHAAHRSRVSKNFFSLSCRNAYMICSCARSALLGVPFSFGGCGGSSGRGSSMMPPRNSGIMYSCCTSAFM